MCFKVVRKDPYPLQFVPKDLDTQEMCNAAMEEDLYNLIYISNWFVTPKMRKDLDNVYELNNDDLNNLSDLCADNAKY